MVFTSCTWNMNYFPKGDYRNKDLFENTPAKELINAIEKDSYNGVKKICEDDTSLVNFQESVYGICPLICAIGMAKYNAAKALIESGANPNLKSFIGTSPMFEAVSYRWYDTQIKCDTIYLKLLLSYGGDPNSIYKESEIEKDEGEVSVVPDGTSLLMYAIDYSDGFPYVRILVEAGADIEYRTKFGRTAAIEALLMEDLESAHYLIVEKKAQVKDVYYVGETDSPPSPKLDDPRDPVNLLLVMTYERDTRKYQLKMDIVKEFENQGVDYQHRKKFIDKGTLYHIKHLHPNDWKDYIEMY